MKKRFGPLYPKRMASSTLPINSNKNYSHPPFLNPTYIGWQNFQKILLITLAEFFEKLKDFKQN